MAYKGIGEFVTRVTLRAIAKLDAADVDECMRIAENVNAWYSAGTINDEQLERLLNALPVEVSEDENSEPENEVSENE